MTTFGSADYSMSKGRGSYADPHSTIAIRDIPTNLKLVQRLCRFYYCQDALLGAIVDKMSEYPITALTITGVDDQELTPKARDKWEELLNVTLNVREVMINVNVDKYLYGNSFHYISYPFVRYCTCNKCKTRNPITALRDVTAQPDESGGNFTLRISAHCEKCKSKMTHKVEDRKSEARTGMSLVRLSPLRMELEYNPISGHRRWYWDPPVRIRDGMLSGDRTIIDFTEMKILEAAYRGQKILVNRDRLWVAQAASLPGIWEGWGVPPLFRVLEDVYYYKILRRANEALAQEHVVPMRVLSPAGTGDISPQRTMNLSDWQNRLKSELMQFKRDPNHLMISPLPINVEQIGGQGRVMMVAAEMEAAARVIAAGVGCPIEMIWGGLNWSGASVALRVLENHFLNDRENCQRLLTFLVPKIAAYFRMPRIQAKLSDFRMADDIQQQGNLINLMLQGYLSRKSVIGEMGFDPEEEFKSLSDEHKQINLITMEDNVAASHMKTVIMTLEAKAQILLNYELQMTQAQIAAQSERERLQMLKDHVQALHAKGMTSPLEFDQSAALLGRLDPNMSGLILQAWGSTMPNVTLLLQEKLRQTQQGIAERQSAMEGAGANVDPGAAQDMDLQTAAGPYSGGGDGPEQPDQLDVGGDDAPTQRPPQRDEGTAGAQV
jgi:hypothetical protein